MSEITITATVFLFFVGAYILGGFLAETIIVLHRKLNQEI